MRTVDIYTGAASPPIRFRVLYNILKYYLKVYSNYKLYKYVGTVLYNCYCYRYTL